MGLSFNEEQMQVIEHINGPLLCIAGPGSGKTTSIIQRVVNMTNHGIDPNKILVVTFTKAAADEMKKKYAEKDNAKFGVTFGTIHSFCFSVLREYDSAKYNKDSILTDIEQKDFIRSAIRPLRIEWTDQDRIINSIIGAISAIKNNGINPYNIEIEGCGNDAFTNIYHAYEDFKVENNKIDYDDMLYLTNKIFEKDSGTLNLWRERFEYLIVDEFQDTNYTQAKIIYDVAYPQNNICIIGDDDQSIYMFRGAVPKIMLDFEKKYPNCKKVILNKNYRSESIIVESTKRLIEHNKVRFEKPLKAVKNGYHGRIDFITVKNRDKEISRIVKDIKAKEAEGIRFDEIAILYRTNTQAAQVSQALIKADIPFYTYELVINIYDHWIFRDLKLFKKVVDQTCSLNEFLAIINRPNKYISRKILPAVYSEEGVLNAPFKLREDWKKKKMFDTLNDWYNVIHQLKEMTPYEFIGTIRRDIKYDKFIEEYAENNKMDKSQFFDILDEIEEASEPFSDFNSWMNFVEAELATFKEKMKNKKKENSVILSTMHRSKGLEWDHVIIIDANEDITPYQKAETEEEIEEERRMFYVAATRARETLQIYSIEKRNKTPMMISRFVKEMQEEPETREEHIQKQLKDTVTTNFKRNDWVFHKTFGMGMVTVISEDFLMIAFEKTGLKKLEKKWCLENLQKF